jgi:GNAT superfamily N-acetyltransferase
LARPHRGHGRHRGARALTSTRERLAAHGLTLPAGHTLVSLAERPELRDPLGAFNVAVWPEFMLHDDVPDRLWHHLGDDFPAHQLVLLGPSGELVAGCNAAPLWWDGTDAGLPEGWDAQFERTVADLLGERVPNTLGALQIVVRPDRQGSGLSALMLGAMRANARAHGLGALIACVRPTEKHRYALIPIESYAQWTRADGLPFDPWIRVHVRAGGRIVRASPHSMRMQGTVAEWAEWTGLSFPVSGQYLPPLAATPVEVDVAADVGRYFDPNVWVVHDLRP